MMEQKPDKPPAEIKNQVKRDKSGKKKKDNVSVLPIIILSVLIILLLGAWGYLVFTLPKKAAAVQKIRTQGLAVYMSEQDEKLLSQTLKETEEKRQKLITAFPTETTLLEFIKIIDSLRGTDVTVVRFSVDSDVPTKIGKNPRFLPMSLSLRGTPEAVDQAFKKIADSPYFIRTIMYTQDIDPVSGQVTVQTQFHLYVADAFTKTNS